MPVPASLANSVILPDGFNLVPLEGDKLREEALIQSHLTVQSLLQAMIENND